jgi:hypothetical protein
MVIQLVVKVVGTHRQARRRREQLRLASEPVTIPDNKKSDPKQSKRVLTVDGRLIDEMILEPEDEEEEDGLDDESDEKDKLDQQKLVDECPEGVLIDDLSDQVTTRRCTLCLGPRKDQTSLECGHLFCWWCLVSWIREKVSRCLPHQSCFHGSIRNQNCRISKHSFCVCFNCSPSVLFVVIPSTWQNYCLYITSDPHSTIWQWWGNTEKLWMLKGEYSK